MSNEYDGLPDTDEFVPWLYLQGTYRTSHTEPWPEQMIGRTIRRQAAPRQNRAAKEPSMTKIYVANYALDDWKECFDVSDHDFAWPSIQEVVAATTEDPETDPALRAMIEAVKQIVEGEIAETFDTSYLEPEDQEPMPVVVWTEQWNAKSTDRQVVRLFATKKQEAVAGNVAAEGEYEGMSDADTFSHPEGLAEIAVVRDTLFVPPA